MPETSDPRDPGTAARAASLRYVSGTTSGITRRRTGGGFGYRAPDGSVLNDKDSVARIKALAIPPAWTSVWICPSPHGHIQATGRDARARKQYRYHRRWREVRDDSKYGRLGEFARHLPHLRERIEADLAESGLSRTRVLAIVVRLLESTYIRVGNEEYARTNKSFGLTTLRSRHARVAGSGVELSFQGKSGKAHTVKLTDRRLARLVKRCRDLPGQQLFQYLDDDGAPQPIDSADVNEYLRTISGTDFTAKDFRTWGGTLMAASELASAGVDESGVPGKAAQVEAVKDVAARLGNTPAVCRKSYIHPLVLDAFTDADRYAKWGSQSVGKRTLKGLDIEESRLLRFLEAD